MGSNNADDDIVIEKLGMRRSVSSDSAFESTRTMTIGRFESPRSHSELHEELDGPTIQVDRAPPTRSRRRSRPDPSGVLADPRPKRSSSLQPQGTTQRPPSRPRSSRALSVSRKSMEMSGRSSTSCSVSKNGRSSTKSLLHRLTQPNSCLQPNLDESLPASPRKAERRVSYSHHLSDRNGPDDLQARDRRKSAKRISVRVLRLQQKAAITIQAIFRRFLARCKYRKILLKMQYGVYVEEKKKRKAQLEKERRDFMGRLMTLERETQNEVKAMKTRHENAKRDMEESMRRNALSQTAISDGLLDARLAKLDDEMCTLKNEQAKLIAEISLVGDMISDMEQENEKLQTMNEKVMTMFITLNDFAKASVVEKRRLEDEARMFNKTEVQKIRQEIRLFSPFAMVESATKDVYRGCMYRYVYYNVKNQYNDDAFENILNTVRQVEESLGHCVLDASEAILLLEKKDPSDPDCDSDDDDGCD